MTWITTFIGWLQGDNSPVILASLVALAALTMAWGGLVARDPIGGRLKELAKMRDGLRTNVGAARRNQAREDFRQSSLNLMRNSVAKFNLMRGRQIEKISARLSRAGWRSRDAMTGYLFAKGFFPLLVMAGGILFLVVRSQVKISPTLSLIAVSVAALCGLFGVDKVITMIGDARIKRLTRALPDALDLLVICAEAGLGLDAAIARVGVEMGQSAPDLSDELLLTSAEMNFLPDRQLALKNLVMRTDMMKLRALVNSLIQSERFGTPLANALRVLSAEFREERSMRAEEKAARLPAIMTIPLILFVLPSIFMIVIGPAVIHIMDNFKGVHH